MEKNSNQKFIVKLYLLNIPGKIMEKQRQRKETKMGCKILLS